MKVCLLPQVALGCLDPPSSARCRIRDAVAPAASMVIGLAGEGGQAHLAGRCPKPLWKGFEYGAAFGEWQHFLNQCQQE